MAGQRLPSRDAIGTIAEDWWLQAPSILGESAGSQRDQGFVDWYQFGDGFLGVDADDPPFRQRFRRIFTECATPPPTEGQGPIVRCRVQSASRPFLSLIRFDDPEPLDSTDFALTLFGDRGYVEIPSSVDGWRLLSGPSSPAEPMMAARGNYILADQRKPWQALVGSCGFSRVLRLQREMMFLHAASVVIGGSGALLSGPKGSGKTTISIALALRGHDFLGDEVAAIRTGSYEMVPFRRSVSIKPGPCASIVGELLRAGNYKTEVFPDGSARVQIAASALIPGSGARPGRVRSIFFLRRFASKPRVEQFAPGHDHLRLLALLGGSMWGISPGRRIMKFLDILSRARCYFLDVGPPEETAELVEQTVEGRWFPKYKRGQRKLQPLDS